MARVGAGVAPLSALDQQVRRSPVALLRDHADAAARGAERDHLRHTVTVSGTTRLWVFTDRDRTRGTGVELTD